MVLCKLWIKVPQLRRFRIKGRENPWFSSELADIHEHNLAWAKSRKTGSPTVWLLFRQLKNKWTSFNKKVKSEYYLPVTTENQNIQINQKNKKQIKEFLENHLVLTVNKSSHALLTFFFFLRILFLFIIGSRFWISLTNTLYFLALFWLSDSSLCKILQKPSGVHWSAINLCSFLCAGGP